AAAAVAETGGPRELLGQGYIKELRHGGGIEDVLVTFLRRQQVVGGLVVDAAVGVHASPVAGLGDGQVFVILSVGGLLELLGIVEVAQRQARAVELFADLPVPGADVRISRVGDQDAEDVGIGLVER